MTPEDVPNDVPQDEDETPYTPWLVVHDGIPWYASADIWVVPGSNPGGVPGPPVVGKKCWVWARVWNDGDAPIFNAVVNFYWANPATGVTRANATLIGTEYVSVPAHDYKQIYCKTPWVPKLVNNGHECLVVEAYEPLLDPLMAPGSNNFMVQADRHVAQRNVIVTFVAAGQLTVIEFASVNPDLEEPKVVDLEIAPLLLDDLAGLAKGLGMSAWPSTQWESCEASIYRLTKSESAGQPSAAAMVEAGQAEPCSQLELEPGERARMAVAIGPAPQVPAGTAQAYAITQQIDDQMVGGIVVLVIHGRESLLFGQERLKNHLLLEYTLAHRPPLLRALLDDPQGVLARLDMGKEALACPEEAHWAYERSRRIAAAVDDLGPLLPVDALPKIAELAQREFGDDYLVTKIPFGLRFAENVPDAEEAAWTATATFECVFGPGCHADVDG